jgi:ribose transport system substrate-binding protein
MLAFGIFALIRYGKSGAKEYNLILIPKVIDETNGFWTALIEGAKLGASENSCNITVSAPEKEIEYEKQIQIILDSIEKKPDAIIVAASSFSETTGALQKVLDAGIELILVDSVIDTDLGVPIVATDNIDGGRQLGEYTRQFVKENSRIGMVGHVKDVSTAIEREAGMREGLGEYADRIDTVVFCGSSYDVAYELTCEMVETHPDIDIIMCMNEYSTVGTARAIDDLGLKDKITVTGFDNSIEEVQLIEKGVIKATVIQKPFNMGYLAAEEAIKGLLGGETSMNVDSGCLLITPENMYDEESQRLLFPFLGQQ